MNAVAVPSEARQAIIDEEQLRLLSIAHYIDGGLCIFFFSMFIFHFLFFLFIGNNPQFFSVPNRPGPPEGLFQAVSAILGVVILLGWAFGGLTMYVGRCI